MTPSGRRVAPTPLLLLMLLALLAACAWLACGAGPEDAAPDRAEDLEAWDALDRRKALGDGTGRYRVRRGAGADPDLDREERERLAALGYLEGTRAAQHGGAGVTRFDPARSAGGTNLYVSAHAPEAALMDMEGRVLQRWRCPSADIWPGHKQERMGARYFRRAYLLEDGGLLVIFEGLGIARLDRDSRVVWAVPPEGDDAPSGHHDLEIQPNGELLALTRKPRTVAWIHPDEPILDDFVTVYGPGGETRLEISLADAFEKSRYRDLVLRGKRKKGDIFHTNSIHRLDGSVAHLNPDFDPGNVLLSIRHLHLLAVLDPNKREIVWASAGPFRLQHDAEVLPNGHVFLFDNGALDHEDSRALELDPKTLEIRWQYRGSESDPLWSQTCGTVQRLPGGNTLVVESDNGRAIEVTPDGEIVWEWLSPHRAGDEDELVATLFDLTRLPVDAWP